MKRMMHILRVAAMLLMAWPFAACERSLVEGLPELSISIQIPEMSATKAETGSVEATKNEKKFTSLQLWVFLHTNGTDDGTLVGYKGFTAEQLKETGLQHTTITRFGMLLTPEMFTLLSKDDTKVDVYALANAASATSETLGEGTSRATLDALVLSDATFGVSPLTMTIPNGLPMSGVLKGASVTGSYPVLNISTVTLTRAVSKIRFVFCQQGTPATDTDLVVPDNVNCMIKSISFGGTTDGHDCQIAESEKLFTNNTYTGTENLFDISGYTPLSTVIAGEGNAPLRQNSDISVCEHPDLLLFRSKGHLSESAQEYESRLDEALKAWPESQVGPIYIRETDKLISGTIVYNTGGDDLTATFSMEADDKNILSRNHSWILFAYFADATKTLQFKIVVLPWDKQDNDYSYEANTVNVVRRFTIPENPTKFKKHQNENGYYDIYFWHTLNDQPNVIKGDIIIATPVGQKIHVVPVPGAPEGRTPIADLFTVTPLVATIYQNGTTTENCKIDYEITCNPGTHTEEELEGNYLDLHFCIEIGNGERWIDLDSESIDFYRIILKKDWQNGGE